MKHIKNKFLIYSLFTISFSAQVYTVKRIPVPPPITQEYF